MKQNLLSFSVSLLIVIIMASCSTDSKPVETYSIVGEWTTKSRVFKSTNYTDSVDRIINDALRRDMDKYTLKKTFPKETQQQKADGTIEGSLTFTGTPKSPTTSPRYIEGTYKLANDSIHITERDTNISYWAQMGINNTTMITRQKMTFVELTSLLNQINILDPNVLPNDIQGVLTTTDNR